MQIYKKRMNDLGTLEIWLKSEHNSNNLKSLCLCLNLKQNSSEFERIQIKSNLNLNFTLSSKIRKCIWMATETVRKTYLTVSIVTHVPDDGS